MFSRRDTFVGLVFDARFNFEFYRRRKNRIVRAYHNYVIGKLRSSVETIYLVGHSRGGCLVMLLAAMLTRTYPNARVIVHNYDGVCTARKAIMRWTKSEFGVRKEFENKPVRRGYRVVTTDINVQFSNRECLAVRSFLSGSPVLPKALNPRSIRGFGHRGFNRRVNSLTTLAGFNWYTQSFHSEHHVDIERFPSQYCPLSFAALLSNASMRV
eukprot:IDg8829t1